MVELLYLKDSYIGKFRARVTGVSDEGVFLDRTAFFPRSGGLEGDRGKLLGSFGEIEVKEVKKLKDDVLHVVEETDRLDTGIEVEGVLDWENRYRQMRLHTASHIISALFYEMYGALVTGGHITSEKAKEMYDLERITPEMIEEVFSEANRIVKKNLPVKVYWLKREEAIKVPGIVKLADRMPPNVNRWRIVEIPGVDIQADGGPHVRRTGEIGEIVFLRKENKGRGKKMITFTVKP